MCVKYAPRVAINKWSHYGVTGYVDSGCFVRHAATKVHKKATQEYLQQKTCTSEEAPKLDTQEATQEATKESVQEATQNYLMKQPTQEAIESSPEKRRRTAADDLVAAVLKRAATAAAGA